jgi:hypothetical protein
MDRKEQQKAIGYLANIRQFVRIRKLNIEPDIIHRHGAPYRETTVAVLGQNLRGLEHVVVDGERGAHLMLAIKHDPM